MGDSNSRPFIYNFSFQLPITNCSNPHGINTFEVKKIKSKLFLVNYIKSSLVWLNLPFLEICQNSTPQKIIECNEDKTKSIPLGGGVQTSIKSRNSTFG